MKLSVFRCLPCLSVSVALLSPLANAQTVDAKSNAVESSSLEQRQQSSLLGTWPLQPPRDEFSAQALLDLRYLNEKVAGQSGFVRLSPSGNEFVLGNGQPARFWAVNSFAYRGTPAEMERQARFLAKIGVNMVRIHGSISPRQKGAPLTAVNDEEIDRIQRFVSILKKQGIYTTISPFWANAGHAGAQSSWGLEGYGDGQDVWGLLFFNDKLQSAYKSWIRALYTRPNPYENGVPLGRDAGVAILQVQNEDSLFFWTMQSLKPEQMRVLQGKYASWLQKKYLTLEGARAAWNDFRVTGDDFQNNRVGLMNVWQMTQPQPEQSGAARRLRDEIEFFARTQHDFYAGIAEYLKKDLKCQQIVNASNWITADTEKLGDIERWTYSAMDAQAVNKYTGGVHIGENSAWRIDPGHNFTGASALLDPQILPTNLKQVAGHPFLVTEANWVSPTPYQSEGPFLTAAYQALSGVDIVYWFSSDASSFTPDPYFPYAVLQGGQKGILKFNLTPALETMFPACALMFRRGDVQPGATVVHEERSLENLWNRTLPVVSEGRAFLDPNRVTEFASGTPANSRANSQAFLVGRVEVKYGGDTRKTRVADLSRFLNNSNATVTSSTGEITLNTRVGICTVNSPRAQGVSGFWGKTGSVSLKDLTIRCANPYATILAISLDNDPLIKSKRVLLQVGTIAHPTGWQTQAASFVSEDGKSPHQGEKILNTGTMPWRFAKTDAAITLQNPHLKTATTLDANGMNAGNIALTRNGARLTVKLPPDAFYVLLR